MAVGVRPRSPNAACIQSKLHDDENSNVLRSLAYALTLVVAALTAGFVGGCAQEKASFQQPASQSPAALGSPTPAPTPSAEDRIATAEGRYLVSLSADLAATIRAQPWFTEMAPEHLSLIAAILATERAAGARGETDSVAAALDFATQQAWYADGFDAAEAIGLRGVFQTYTVSLEDWRAPQIGPVLASTIAYELTATLELPESGTVVVLVSSEDPELGRTALDLAVQWLPQVEAVTGAFPYSFLHITITELYELYAGLSYDEFISLAPDSVTEDVVIHELTHSTLYGIFPTWFEEGFAHFMEYYLPGRLDEGEAYFREELAFLEAKPILNIGPRPYDFYEHLVDRATGFLFVKGLYEINGIEDVVATIRSLRTKTFSDQELLKRLIETDDPDRRAVLEAYVCQNVIGTTRNYCR